MNDLLKNIIKIGDVVIFIDDVIVKIETKEEHDNIVEEVLRRIAENNLFVKLEKYVWKVKKIRFLGVVVGLDKVKMEKKVQRVVNWQVPRCHNILELLYFILILFFFCLFSLIWFILFYFILLFLGQ